MRAPAPWSFICFVIVATILGGGSGEEEHAAQYVSKANIQLLQPDSDSLGSGEVEQDLAASSSSARDPKFPSVSAVSLPTTAIGTKIDRVYQAEPIRHEREDSFFCCEKKHRD
eukprot:GHVU01209806.1.p1 GENE.GHVU01209806.1~~GHVU01209806.1.p1  ORF type:complete len:113 (+),score=15.94 GHVU01209806.1:302-640(+)